MPAPVRPPGTTDIPDEVKRTDPGASHQFPAPPLDEATQPLPVPDDDEPWLTAPVEDAPDPWLVAEDEETALPLLLELDEELLLPDGLVQATAQSRTRQAAFFMGTRLRWREPSLRGRPGF